MMNKTLRPETGHPSVAPIVTGHFVENAAYATWRTQGTRDYLLMLTLSGGGRVGWRGGEQRIVPGDAVLLRPGTLHDYGTARGLDVWELLWTHFAPRPHWQEWLLWPEVAPGIARLSLGDNSEGRIRIEDALREMRRWERGGQPRRDEFAMNALEKALLWCDAVNPRSAQAKNRSAHHSRHGTPARTSGGTVRSDRDCPAKATFLFPGFPICFGSRPA